MNRITQFFFVFLLIVFLFPTQVLAKVLINEIYPNPEGNDNQGDNKEWVELYNTEDQTVSLVGWYLVDAKGNKKELDSLGEIEGTSKTPFKVFTVPESQGWLNNDGEEKVHLYNNNAEYVDGYTFVNASEDGVVYGRYPDGDQPNTVWDKLDGETKGSANHAGFPTPTPEPTNTPTPEPEPTATPTPPPSPTPEPTPTLAVKKTTITPQATKQVSDNRKKIFIGEPEEELAGNLNVEGLRKQVLAGQTSLIVDNESSISGSSKEKINSLSFALIAGGGLLLVIAAVPMVRRLRGAPHSWKRRVKGGSPE